jgi:hypothetical protein
LDQEHESGAVVLRRLQPHPVKAIIRLKMGFKELRNGHEAEAVVLREQSPGGLKWSLIQGASVSFALSDRCFSVGYSLFHQRLKRLKTRLR